MQVLQPEKHAQWLEVLGHAFQYDFYHLPQYHALAEELKEDKAHLFLYREGDFFVTIPLLLRSIETVPCHGHAGQGYWDATCVYGYAGPIASHPEIPAPVLRNFRAVLWKALQERNIVTVFSRLHPLIPQQRWLLAGLGEFIPIGQTVSIDLTLPLEVQRSQYRQNHKRDLNKLKRHGATCVRDPDRVYLNEFVDIYHENMHRVGASSAYFFAPTYFERLVTIH
jgi:hypothetical protein